MTEVLIMANDHQHLLEAIETLYYQSADYGRRSSALVGNDRNISKVPIMSNDHQHLLEATLLHKNTDNVNKDTVAVAKTSDS